MAEPEAANKPAEAKTRPADVAPEWAHVGAAGRAKNWITEEGPWWLCSFVFHLVLVCSLALISGKVVEKIVDEAPSFEEANIDKVDVPKEIERFDVGDTPVDPSDLSTDTLTVEKPAQMQQDDTPHDAVEPPSGGTPSTAALPNLGGLGGFDVKGLGAGPVIKGKGGVGIGVGTGTHPGSGGDGWGFNSRSAGAHKAMLASGGGTKQSERAVAAALNWIARHQLPDGSWSLKGYKSRCKDASCTDPGGVGDRTGGATALALLPFLAAGQTHKSTGPYKQSIHAGIAYLVTHQKNDGDLRMKDGQMYDQGLATIALCECYGMTGDKLVGRAAQGGLNFIRAAQDPIGGGWRYVPREAGDTSAVGWQFMAMKSGMMAYLDVDPAVFERAKTFLRHVSTGKKSCLGIGSSFGYTGPPGTPALSAVGLLCSQYLGTPRTDPAMIEGTAMIMANQPNPDAPSMYLWYYATQVMHNQPGPDWDVWNRKMRRALIDTQCKEDKCAAGSWGVKNDWIGKMAGRLYMTSLSALTLEVYYRYLPLYKLDTEGAAPAANPLEKHAGKSLGKPVKKAPEVKKAAK